MDSHERYIYKLTPALRASRRLPLPPLRPVLALGVRAVSRCAVQLSAGARQQLLLHVNIQCH